MLPLGLSASARAGDYNVASCTSNTIGLDQGGWDGDSSNSSPSNSGNSTEGLYINHNQDGTSQFNASLRTYNRNESGKFIIAKVSHSPIGPYISNCPGILFTNTGDTLQGVVVRNGVDDSGASGVGNTSWAAAVLRAPPGGSIVGMSGNLYTLSIKALCGAPFNLSCNSAPRAYNNLAVDGQVNVSDKGWYGRWFQDWSGSEGHSGGSPPTGGVGFVMTHIACGSPGGCLTTSTGNSATRYLRAASQVTGSSEATMRENNAPESVWASGTLLNGWVRGIKDVRVYSTDSGSGTYYTNISFNAGRTNAVSNMQPCNWGRSSPCPQGQAHNDFSFNTADLSNGQHTLYARGVDIAGNARDATYTVQVDNQNPNTGSCSEVSTTPPSGEEASDGRRWLRAIATVVSKSCDAVSGLSSYKVQYQALSPNQYTPGLPLVWTSSWQDAAGSGCSSSTQTSANQTGQLNCNVDTSAFADGTAIRFRGVYVDKAGNSDVTPESSVRYLDNTAPTLQNMKWQAYKGSTGNFEDITTGWTNAKKTRLSWNPISAGNGSPINKYFYSYDPDLEDTGSGACSTQQSSSWLSAVGVTATPALDEERSEECRQGRHQVWVWVQDVAGNGAVGSPPSSYKNAAAGTSQISYDSVPTAETRDLSWARSDSLMPESLSTDPGEWSTTNSFTASWTNPSILNTVTQSPISTVLYQIGGRDTVGSLSAADVQTYSDCIGSGAQCSLSGLKAPSEGSHPLRLWVRDAAGNSSLEQSAAGQINWRKNICVTP